MITILTGGTGKLGHELTPRIKGELLTPSREELNITSQSSVKNYASNLNYEEDYLIVHCAAYTNVPKAEVEKDICWKVNVEGTKNLLDYLEGSMVFISTDYVFSGENDTGRSSVKGKYKEEDTPNPQTYYGLSKLVAEQMVRVWWEDSIILRTSFKPEKWPHPVAYTDQFTSADFTDTIAEQVAWVINNFNSVIEQTSLLNLGTSRKSVYDLVKQRNPEVWPGKRREGAPEDTSLDTTQYRKLRQLIL